jgi:hypothetical protein
MSLTPLTAFASHPAEPGSGKGSPRWTARCSTGPCVQHCALRPRAASGASET